MATLQLCSKDEKNICQISNMMNKILKWNKDGKLEKISETSPGTMNCPECGSFYRIKSMATLQLCSKDEKNICQISNMMNKILKWNKDGKLEKISETSPGTMNCPECGSFYRIKSMATLQPCSKDEKNICQISNDG